MESQIIDAKKKFLREIPQAFGIYIFKNLDQKPIYIGKSTNIKDRVASYFGPTNNLKIKFLISEAKFISTVLADNEIDALILEANLIKKYQPKYNSELKDSKFYPYLKITVKEPVPRVLICRKVESDGSLYFGPYPNAGGLYRILKFLRRVFPSCLHKKPYGSCLYVHLGLCPYPYVNINQRRYRQTIKYIIDFLSGKKNKVIRILEKNLAQAIREEKFEEATILKKQLETIAIMHLYRKTTDDDLESQARLQKLHETEINSLKSTLAASGVFVNQLSRIEGFDVSNIQGREATGSLIVLERGLAKKNDYKRFRIKRTANINDYAMMKEVISRRFTHPEWPFPDLIVVDGGAGQLKSCLAALGALDLNISAIGLAKRLETIYLASGKKINLTLDNPGLHLIQRARDEAHRFAQKYHKLLRSKSMFI
ncbi:GIY-YIG nuclease family protein [Candidatus Gottesmanbacteria bacterium]|nr:GIY-YIG nuclease family protein [Candidatus Gottesmanbacteria bacterium]